MNAWGWHFALDCAAGKNVDDKEHILAFVKELVSAIDMVAFGETWIERFATHDASKSGISFCQMIETSNICGHFVEKNGDFYLDIFSCKPFDINMVKEVTMKYFAPVHIKQNFFERSA